MKKLSTLLGLITIILFSACKSKQVALPNDEEVISLPCTGPDLQSDKDFFRASAVGESLDLNTAKDKAIINVKQQIAANIGTVLSNVSDSYAKSNEVNNEEEVLEKFESLTRTKIKQYISNTKIICDKLSKSRSTGKYKYYVAMEMPAESVLKPLISTLSDENNTKIEESYNRFKKIFDEEMSN